MARPREFDEADVLARARDEFWSNGVAATSISALSGATGLSVGSIYKAFKSKDELCSRTLEDYLAYARSHIAATLADAPTPLVGLRAWLDAIIEQAIDTSPTRGCYAVELAAERAAVDEDVRTQLVDHDNEMRNIVGQTVRRAVDAGELTGDPDGITRLICTTVNGLQVDARKGLSEQSARLTIDTMLTALGA
ncbi:MAG: TetR/AcrR family transcriptional regulator [Actinomycetota bacterium]